MTDLDILGLKDKLLETKEGTNKLMNIAISVQNYKLADEIRTYREENFPDTRESRREKRLLAPYISAIKAMGGTNTDQDIYMFVKTIEIVKKKKHTFSLSDIEKIKTDAIRIFG